MSAQKEGQELETAINRMHRAYMSAGRAWCWHTFPPFLIDRRLAGGRFMGRLLGEAPPDYLVFSGGRFFMLEAKSFKLERFPWANLKAHQARQLSILDGFEGATAALVIRCVPRREVAVVLWAEVEEAWNAWRLVKTTNKRAPRGAGSIAWDELRERAAVVLRWPDVDYLEALTCKLIS